MALRDSEGFGLSTTAADFLTYGAFMATSTGGTASIATGVGVWATDNYLNLAGSGSSGTLTWERVLPGVFSTFYTGVRTAYFSTGASGCTSQMYFYDSLGNEQFHLNIDNSGNLGVYRGATLLGTLGAAFSVGGSIWSYLEVGAVVATSGGSVTVRVNNGTVLSLTGLNNQNSANAGVGRVGWSSSGTGGGQYASQKLAHFYFNDNTGTENNGFMGDSRVQTVSAASNASVSFAPQGLANNFQNAALVPPVPGTDYNQSSTVGAIDLFNPGTVAASLGTVFAVNVKALVGKNDAGYRQAATILQSGGTNAVGPAVNLGITPIIVPNIVQNDPSTGVPLTNAAVRAMEIGYEVAG